MRLLIICLDPLLVNTCGALSTQFQQAMHECTVTILVRLRALMPIHRLTIHSLYRLRCLKYQAVLKNSSLDRPSEDCKDPGRQEPVKMYRNSYLSYMKRPVSSFDRSCNSKVLDDAESDRTGCNPAQLTSSRWIIWRSENGREKCFHKILIYQPKQTNLSSRA